jgi:putative ABC transport system ATP-binding protein
MLELIGVAKRYAGAGENVNAVDGVDLTITPGEFVALYGPSGSGKTTLLLIAAGLIAPDSGSVRFDGRDLASFSTTELADHQRRELGFVYQSFHLITGVSALDNAAMKALADGMSVREARRAATPWLERVGLDHRQHHPPESLSGGERQRVGIARALVGEPRLILADEPTGNLDSKRGAEILSLLADICHERRAAVVLATHDPRAATLADRALSLSDGRLDPSPPDPIVALPSAAGES